MTTPLGIDEVVQRTGLSAHTLRYYERIGLIAPMQAFARLRAEGDRTMPARRMLLEAHLAQVQASVQAMQHAAIVLDTKIKHYRAAEQAAHHLEKAA